MIKVSCSLFIILAIFGQTDSAERSLPPYIQACKENDPELNKCIVENGNKAIPYLKDGDKKFRIIAFDPVKVKEASIEPGGNLKLHMTNIEFVGLANGKITEAEAHLKDGKILVKLATPSISILGDYDIDGRLVILPITGNGRTNITATDFVLTCNINFKVEEQNGIRQLVLDKTTISYTTNRVYYNFGNLFGDSQSTLAIEMAKFMDENWKEIDKEFSADLNILIATILQAAMSQVFKDVPYEKVFLP